MKGKGMDKLKFAIGPSPSEMSLEELTNMLTKERERMSNLLSAMRTNRKARTPSTRAKRASAKRKSKSTKMTAKDVAKFNALLEGLK